MKILEERIKVKTRIVNTFHLETKHEKEIVVDTIQDGLILWIGNAGQYNFLGDMDWSDIELNKEEVEVLIEALQTKLKDLK